VAVPAIAAMRSIHTAVGWFATALIAAPSEPPVAAACARTCAAQSGLT
jgi:hypothetical protein